MVARAAIASGGQMGSLLQGAAAALAAGFILFEYPNPLGGLSGEAWRALEIDFMLLLFNCFFTFDSFLCLYEWPQPMGAGGG